MTNTNIFNATNIGNVNTGVQTGNVQVAIKSLSTDIGVGCEGGARCVGARGARDPRISRFLVADHAARSFVFIETEPEHELGTRNSEPRTAV